MDEKKGAKKIFDFIKNRGTAIMLAAVICILAVVVFQNREMMLEMNKYFSSSEDRVHEIYDDTKVITAYKAGSKDGLDEKESFLFDKIGEVLGEIVNDDMSEYEKEKAVYDWLFTWVRNSGSELNPIQVATDNFTPYGVLKSHSAICVGNATTFKLFMGALDIPCKIIHSTESGEHAWDVVQLGGEWYHVDLSFDGGYTKPSYDYFNVPDSMKDDGNWPWDHDAIPACNGYEYSYYYMNAVDCENIYGIPKIIADARDNGDSNVVVVIKDNAGFSTSLANFIANGILTGESSIRWDGAYWLGKKLVCVWKISNWSDDIGEIPEEIRNKMQDKIDKVNENFGDFGDFGDGSYAYGGKG